jgi:hypothetical protein
VRDVEAVAGRAGSANLALLKRLLDPMSRRQQQQQRNNPQQQQQQNWQGFGRLPELRECSDPLQQAGASMGAAEQQQQQQQGPGQSVSMQSAAAAAGHHPGSSSSSLGMSRSASLPLAPGGLL